MEAFKRSCCRVSGYQELLRSIFPFRRLAPDIGKIFFESVCPSGRIVCGALAGVVEKRLETHPSYLVQIHY
jgi:hypothetical protein